MNTVLIQSIVIWGGVTENKLSKIQIKHYKNIRHVYGIEDYQSRNLPTIELYKELNIFKGKDVYRYFLIKFMHYVSYESFDLFIKYFSHHLSQGNYNLRDSTVDLPKIRTEVERSFTNYNCCKFI